jgi:flagellar hook-length control protein FliK
MSPQNDTQVSQSPATSEQVQRSAYDADVKASENVAAEDARRIVSERESAERLESSQREEQARQGRPDIVPVPGGVRSSADGENRQAQRSLQDADVAVGAVTGERSQSARDTLVNRQERVTQTQGILNQASEGHEAAQRNQNAAGTQTGSRQSGDVSMSGAASSAQILSTENEGDAPVNHQTNRTVSSLSGETKQINESTASAVQQQSSVPTATPRSDAAAGAMAIAQRLQDPAWGRAMGQRAVMMAQYGPRSAEIQLDPPELGAMQIRVHIGHGDQVSVTFTSPNAAVRDALEQQMPRLREMFSEQGLDLNQSTVSDQSTRERNDDSPDRRGGGRGGQYAGDEGAADVPATAQSVPVGLVDYYA